MKTLPEASPPSFVGRQGKMKALQAFVVEPYRVEVREVELPPPAPNQILVVTVASFVSPGTELAVYKGTHQWLQDPKMTEWKFPFRPGYSAAGVILAVGANIRFWNVGDRVSYPGNHASAELLTIGHERGRLWRLPETLELEKAAIACVARYGMGGAIRAGITLGKSAAVLGLGTIGQFALRCLLAAGVHPVVGIDGVAMRREAATLAGATHVIDPAAGNPREQLDTLLGTRGADLVADATGIPDALPQAMAMASDGGQVVVVGSPRGRAKEVNFYDDLHRRYLEVTGAHGNMLFEPAHTRLPGHWNVNKAQNWLLHAIADGRLNLKGLLTHQIEPAALGEAYEGLAKKPEEYLGVLVRW